MTWRQIIPTLFTLAAVLCGFFSIILSLEGDGHYLLAAQFIMLAMLLDGLDGNLARKLKGSSEFGAELDTYVDMMAFGLAPAVLIYKVSLQNYVVWRALMTALVVLSGVIRLARFKVKDPARGQAGYCGLPITACAGWVAIFVFLGERQFLGDVFSLNQGPVAVVFLIGVLLMITLQVSNIRYPKPTKVAAIFAACIVLTVLLFFPTAKLDVFAAVAILALGVAYVIFGPAFVFLTRPRTGPAAGHGP
jgi:CDP-diacylglycerol--serine O-phosphatidyltransferase